MRRHGVAITLAAKAVDDPIGRILEQILVDRPILLDRHQLRALVGWKRIAPEDDPHVRTGHHGERQVRQAIPISERGGGDHLGLVVARLAALGDVSIDAFVERVALVRRAAREAEPMEQLGARDGRRSDDVDRVDGRPCTRSDGEDQRRPIRCVEDVDAGLDLGVKIAAFAQQVGDHRRRGGSAPDRRRRAVSIDDRFAQLTRIHAGKVELAGECDPA